ncbi:TKL family protein kinase [Histomonas meleagridis]|uniref:TKL family protein kinase n=1 Tax=Histomonas meleagridis TaxID=135588 RepID=UPI003559BEF1|nr:TKL family protein kinase [Histomonas meleagridis]KAH0799968.1 TKL family protein kinase [Histomonas meleagridis]
MSSEIGVPLFQWIQSLRADILQILKLYKSVVIHRTKLACVCSELHAFVKKLAVMKCGNKIASPTESIALRQASQLISDLHELFTNLFEENYIRILLEHPLLYINDKLNEFKNDFNKAIEDSKIIESNVFRLSKEQENVDDQVDCYDLRDKVETIISNDQSISQEESQKLQDKLEEINQRISVLDDTKDSRVLTAEEVAQGFSQFSEFAYDHSAFELRKRIGSGGFADVYLGYHIKEKRFVAIKKMNASQFDKHTFEMLQREIKIASTLNHFAILPFIGITLEPPYYIITEYMSGNSLFKRLHSDSNPLSPTKHTIIALGVACGLSFIHKKGLVHRDIKSPNILLDADDYPKICDFGLSRMISNDSEVMTGGTGTAQWMAPEVLDSKPYGKKADVYSYGILFWELLSHEIPYRGLRDYQVVVAVMQGSRPLIPTTCPRRIAQFIEKCWDKNPENRPDFDIIVKAFESGQLDFPGTNHSEVEAYLNQFIKRKETVFNPGAPSSITLYRILDDLTNNISNLKTIIDDEKWLELFSNEKCIKMFIDSMNKCNTLQLAFDFSLIINTILKNNSLSTIFIENNGTNSYLNLFLKYGVSSMPLAISNLLMLPLTKLNKEHFIKLAPFLITSDLSNRINCSIYIIKLLQGKYYENDSAICQIVQNVLVNVVPESPIELLKLSLELLKYLIEIPKACRMMEAYDFTSKICALLLCDDDYIVSCSLELYTKIVTTTILIQKSIITFVDMFPNLINKFNDQNQRKLIYILAKMIFKSPSAINKFINSNEACEALEKCLESDDSNVVMLSLKTIAGLLIKSGCYSTFEKVYPKLNKFFASEYDSMKGIVASIYTLILQKYDIEKFKTFELKKFILENLNEGELTTQALNLCGVISSTLNGVLFIQEAIPSIVRLLKTKEYAKTALMVLAFVSVVEPMSKPLSECVSTVFGFLGDPEMTQYALILIANITINPYAAIECAKNLEGLVNMIKSDDEMNVKRTFIALERTFGVNEIESYVDEQGIEKLIGCVDEYLKTDQASQILLILDAISSMKIGKEVIINSSLPKFLQSQLEQSAVKGLARSYYQRILLRTLNSTE